MSRIKRFIDDYAPVFMILTIVGVMEFAIGLMTSLDGSPDRQCLRPIRRIELATPWFRLGCWLGEPLR